MIKRSTVPRLLKFSYRTTVYHFRQYAGKNIYLYKSMIYLRIQYPVNKISVWLLGRNSKQRKRCELGWEREGGRRGVSLSEGREWVRKTWHKWRWGREEEEGEVWVRVKNGGRTGQQGKEVEGPQNQEDSWMRNNAKGNDIFTTCM